MRAQTLVVSCALLLSTPGWAERVWLASFSSTGLNAEEERALRERALDEIRAAGGAPSVAAPDAACATDATCRAARMRELPVDAVVELALVRAGPLLQLSTSVHRAGGSWREDRLVQTAEVDRGAALLPPRLLDELRASAAPQEPAPTGGAGQDDTAPADGGAPPVEGVAGRAAPVDDEEIPLLGLIGLGVTAAGLVALVGGSALAVAGNEVLLDPSSGADEKARATLYGPGAVAAAAVGGVVALGGAALAVVGLWRFE